LFASLYADRGSHYWHTPKADGKVDKGNLTQIGEGMARLGIEMIPAYSPEARGRSERIFRTHEARLPQERVAMGITEITEMAPATRYLEEVYRPAFNAEFIPRALEEGSAFVPCIGGQFGDYLCEVYEHTVGKDNGLAFEGMALQIPADRHRMHHVRVKVRVHRYPEGRLAVLNGPRCLARYDPQGRLMQLQCKAAA
jgi:hypothetical protein